MINSRFLASGLLVLASTLSARAGIFFNKHPKPDPATRVPALITTLRTDLDDGKRASAAEELRHFDPTAFPEIVPTLIDAAMRDPKSNVRLEAIQSLTKFRPVSQQVGWALEQVVEKDSSLRLRLQARTALWQYHMSGYHSAKNPKEPPANGVKTEEPPLAAPVLEMPPLAPASPGAASTHLVPVPVTPKSTARPLPSGPPQPLVPVPAPVLQTPSNGDGPDLK
jgi:hypothetical protein